MERYMIGEKSVVIGGDTVLYDGNRIGRVSKVNELAEEKNISFEEALESITKPIGNIA